MGGGGGGRWGGGGVTPSKWWKFGAGRNDKTCVHRLNLD